MSDEVEEDSNEYAVTKENDPPRRKGFFSAFRSHSNHNVPKSTNTTDHEPTGMEQDLINKIEKYSFKNQMKLFYTAYSKVFSLLILHLSLKIPPLSYDTYDPSNNLRSNF